MMIQRVLVVATLVSGVLLVVGSCKDMGDEVPAPPPEPVTAGRNSFNIALGGRDGTTLSGGTRPYAFVSKGDTGIVVPTITIAGDSLKLRAVGLGNSTIIIGDNSSPKLTDTVRVSVRGLAVGQTSFSLLAGDSDSTMISGGTLPYSFISKGDTTKVLPSISGSLLKIRALAAGTSTIIIGDNSSPRLSDTISVNVAAAVLFSTKVQPIFTSSCATSGCHVTGGIIAPMSLEAGVSRSNLVEVTATSGPCAGSKRVKTSDANASVLVKRLDGTTCGQQMPQAGSSLPPAQRQLIRDWINQGARDN